VPTRYRTIPRGRLRESSVADRSGAAFDIERIARQGRRVKMAFSGECDDAFASWLANLAQGLQPTNRGAGTEFLGKLTPRGLLWILRDIDFTLRDGPGAIVLITPERTPGMNEQNLEPASTFPVGQNTRAQRRSWRSLQALPYRTYFATQIEG
jgi:hypothetical protein